MFLLLETHLSQGLAADLNKKQSKPEVNRLIIQLRMVKILVQETFLRSSKTNNQTDLTQGKSFTIQSVHCCRTHNYSETR